MRRSPVQQAPWPTTTQLEQMGLVRCSTAGCTCYLDPANVKSDRCSAHRRQSRERPLAELKFAPLPYRGRGRRDREQAA